MNRAFCFEKSLVIGIFEMSNLECSTLTFKEICEIARQNGLVLPRFALTTKAVLLLYIAGNGSSDVIDTLSNRAQERSKGKKRVYDDEVGGRNVRRRLRFNHFQPVHARVEYDGANFFELPTADEVKECYRSFYRATSNKALKMFVCSVCARELKGTHGGKDLPYSIEVAIGMKVLVTNNIETDLDITNGARGEIIDIILQPDEPQIDLNEAVIR